jgi:hypothetical protein
MKRTAFDTLPSQPFLMESPIVDYGHVDIRNLAYLTTYDGEQTYPDVWAQPWPDLIASMEKLQSISSYRQNPIDACPPIYGECVTDLATTRIG